MNRTSVHFVNNYCVLASVYLHLLVHIIIKTNILRISQSIYLNVLETSPGVTYIINTVLGYQCPLQKSFKPRSAVPRCYYTVPTLPPPSSHKLHPVRHQCSKQAIYLPRKFDKHYVRHPTRTYTYIMNYIYYIQYTHTHTHPRQPLNSPSGLHIRLSQRRHTYITIL